MGNLSSKGTEYDMKSFYFNAFCCVHVSVKWNFLKLGESMLWAYVVLSDFQEFHLIKCTFFSRNASSFSYYQDNLLEENFVKVGLPHLVRKWLTCCVLNVGIQFFAWIRKIYIGYRTKDINLSCRGFPQILE